eukprot:13902644-Alexandrium_andersonii.AAC.1
MGVHEALRGRSLAESKGGRKETSNTRERFARQNLAPKCLVVCGVWCVVCGERWWWWVMGGV